MAKHLPRPAGWDFVQVNHQIITNIQVPITKPYLIIGNWNLFGPAYGGIAISISIF